MYLGYNHCQVHTLLLFLKKNKNQLTFFVLGPQEVPPNKSLGIGLFGASARSALILTHAAHCFQE